jgi:hypothetical protein
MRNRATKENVMRIRNDIESLLGRIQHNVPDSADDILEVLGLQRRRSAASIILPAVGTLVAGALIGSALGMLFGPRYGYRLMDRIGVKIPDKLKETETRMANSSTSNNNLGQSLRTRSDVTS